MPRDLHSSAASLKQSFPGLILGFVPHHRLHAIPNPVLLRTTISRLNASTTGLPNQIVGFTSYQTQSSGLISSGVAPQQLFISIPESNNAFSGRTPPSAAAAATATTHTDSSSSVTNELRENSSLSTGSATVLPPPNAVQMASSPPNETQIGSTPRELNYSQPNARPPGAVNTNYGYQYDSSKDSKDYLPSYEEAIKAMECSDKFQGHRVIPDRSDPMQYYQYPDNGQFGMQDEYFYPQTYHSYPTSDSNISLRRSTCSRVMSCLVVIGFTIFVIRIIKIFWT